MAYLHKQKLAYDNSSKQFLSKYDQYSRGKHFSLLTPKRAGKIQGIWGIWGIVFKAHGPEGPVGFET